MDRYIIPHHWKIAKNGIELASPPWRFVVAQNKLLYILKRQRTLIGSKVVKPFNLISFRFIFRRHGKDVLLFFY